jgi:hypothetical protein
MKKIALVIGVLLLVSIILPVVASEPVKGPATKATTSGYIDTGGIKYYRTIKAVTDKNGGFSGYWKSTSPDNSYSAIILGVEVSGNTAVVKGLVTEGSGFATVGDKICVKLVDNGNGKGAIDKISGTALYTNTESEGWCSTLFPQYNFIGSITVVP